MKNLNYKYILIDHIFLMLLPLSQINLHNIVDYLILIKIHKVIL